MLLLTYTEQKKPENDNIQKPEEIKKPEPEHIHDYKCLICDVDLCNEKKLKRHIKSNEHSEQQVRKGLYAFGRCVYCRLHLYLNTLPAHIEKCHTEHYQEWKQVLNINPITQINNIQNKIKEIKNKSDSVKNIIKSVHVKSATESKKIIRKGKYKYMTEDEIKNHKNLLSRERSRKYYEKNRDRLRLKNIENYKKRTAGKTPKKNGRPKIY